MASPAEAASWEEAPADEAPAEGEFNVPEPMRESMGGKPDAEPVQHRIKSRSDANNKTTGLARNDSSTSTWICAGELQTHRNAGRVWAHAFPETRNKNWDKAVVARDTVQFGNNKSPSTGVVYTHLHLKSPKSARYSVIWTETGDVRIVTTNKLRPIVGGESCSDATWGKAQKACSPAFTLFLNTKVPKVSISHVVPPVAQIVDLMQSKRNHSAHK
jgi:hypothetical protein